jgi:stage II sporulation protein D
MPGKGSTELRYGLSIVALLAALLVSGVVSAHAGTVRVRLWWQHPPPQLRLAGNGGAQWRTCVACTAKPLGNSEIAARGARITIDGSPASGLFLRGSYGLSVDQTVVHLDWPAEIRSRQGRLLITVTMPLEDYVAGVLAGEAGGVKDDEALKAMAVAARTYAVHFRAGHAGEGFDLCDTTHCQDLRISAISPRVREAAARTEGELLWFNGAPAATYYHRSCGGSIEDGRVLQPAHAPAPPYLRAHPDSYCIRAGNDEWRGEISKRDLQAALQREHLPTPPEIATVRVAARTNSGRAESLRLGGAYETTVPAAALRLAVGRALGWDLIRSDAYQITDLGDRLVFFGRGQGHGVGLCQSGAAVMAAEGHDYRDILRYYYPGATVGITAQGLRWTLLADSELELLTTAPDEDRQVMTAAARALREVERRTGWPMAQHPQIRVYPTVAAFRDSTGEPGFVAASTRGRLVRLQPARELQKSGALESTLRHEFAHMLVESRATSNLPLWFREGIVLWIAGPERSGTASPQGVPAFGRRGSSAALAELENHLRTPVSQAQLRRAYVESSALVARLVQKHGQAEVLGWVDRGLPDYSVLFGGR